MAYRPASATSAALSPARNWVLHASARQHYWSGSESLSIKSFSRGRAFYESGGGLFAVDDRSYLLLNHLQPYSITIDSDTAVESLCVFFRAGFAEEVFRSLATSDARLLDLPATPGETQLHFFDRTFTHDDVVSPALFQLRTALSQGSAEPIWLEQQFHGLMQRLLWVHRAVYTEINTLAALRLSTREELYRRLHRARDYAAATFEQPLTLDELASVACLSPNHFLRSFKQLFRQTPHQYLTKLRLERARWLLANTDDSVTDICLTVGFQSLGSFSALFRRHVGASPDQFRRKKGDFREAAHSAIPYTHGKR